MTKDSGQNVDTSVVEDAVEDVVEEIEINTAEDIALIVSEMASDLSDSANSRSFTKQGFKTLKSLLTLDSQVLALMSGCISYALSDQISNGKEEAQSALNISIEYAKNAASMTSNAKKLDSYAKAAVDLGYAEDGVKMEDLSHDQKVQIVSEFLDAQKRPVLDTEFTTWLKKAESAIAVG